MVGFTLKGAGFTVLEGGDGKQALDALNAAPGGKVDVIITDLNMPVMDGITFIQEARRLAQLRYTPILMLTTESQDSMKQKGKAAGATGWIVKPFNPEQLLKVLAKVLP
jgi:two-component system chemotaxis response regulator CheY